MASLTKAERAVERLRELASYARHDIDRTFPVRLYRWAGSVNYEPALEPVIKSLNRVLLQHGEIPKVLDEFEVAYMRAVKAQGKDRAALLKLTKCRDEWREFRTTHRASLGKDATTSWDEFVAWMDRDIEERVLIARAAGRHEGAGINLKAIAKAKRKAEEGGEAVYTLMMSVLQTADRETGEVVARLARYCKRDDPVWERIAEKVAGFEKTAKPEDMINAIQGILGEALALRNPWVVESMANAVQRAKSLARDLGEGWRVVVSELPTKATTKVAGMGELYDSSVWLVRKTAAGTFEAAPVWVLQVKAGSVAEAAEQIKRDVSRELLDKVRIPTVEGKEQEYLIKNLREVVEPPPGAKGAPTYGAASTQRLIVAPRPPSDTSMAREFGKTFCVEYVEALMAKKELRRASEKLAQALKP